MVGNNMEMSNTIIKEILQVKSYVADKFPNKSIAMVNYEIGSHVYLKKSYEDLGRSFLEGTYILTRQGNDDSTDCWVRIANEKGELLIDNGSIKIEEVLDTQSENLVKNKTIAVAIDGLQVQINANKEDIARLEALINQNVSDIATIKEQLNTDDKRMDEHDKHIVKNERDIESANAVAVNHEQRIGESENAIVALQSRASATESTTASHGIAIREHSTAINEIKQTNTQQGSDISKNANDITAIGERVTANENAISEHTTTIGEHTSSIEQINGTLNTQSQSIGSVEERINQAEAVATEQGKKIESNTQGIATASASVQEHETRLAKAESDVSDISGKVNTNTTAIATQTTKVSGLETKVNTIDKAVETATSPITIKGTLNAVSELPKEGNKGGDMYFVKTASNTYDQHVWVATSASSGEWKIVGNTNVAMDISQELGNSTTKVVSQKVVTENFSNLTNFIDSDLIDYGENVVYEKGLVNDDGSIDTASPSFMHTNPITVNKGDVILLESNGGLPNNVSIILKVLNDKYQRIEESFYYKENKFGYIFESDCNIIVNVRDVVYLHIYKSGTLKAIIQKLQQKNKNNIIAYPYKGYYGIDGVYYEDEAFLSTKKIPIVSGNSYEIRADFISKFTEDGTFIERVIASKPNTIYTFEENVKFIAISNQVTTIDNVVFIRNTSELIQTLYNFDSDNTREIDVLKNSDLRNIISFTYSGYYRVDGEFVEDEAYLSTKKISIVSGNSYEIRADFISKFTEDGTFIERVIVSKPNTIYTFEENVKFIAISNQVTTIDNVVFIRNTSELIQTLYDFDSVNTKKIDKINFDIKGQNKYVFVGGFPQIKELYLTNTSIKQVTWIRKNFNGTWQILFNVGISNQYNYQPNGVIPIYTDKDMSIIGGYVVIDWSLQDSTLSKSEDNVIKPVSYSRSFSPIISYYITKDYTNNVGFENRFNIIENDLTKLSKNYERLEKRIGMALSWVDDDFIINQVGVKPRYDLLYDKAIELGFVFDIALIPSSTPDGQDGIVSLDAKIEEVRRFEEAGIAKFLMHPPHYGWYKHSSGDVKLDRVKTSVVKSLRCFSENHILSRYNILVYPGSSASNNDIRKAVTKYFDIAVDSGGQTLIIAQGNNPNFRDRYKLARYAPESRIAQGLTWQQIKDEVQTILDAGQWLILGGHMSAVPISDNLDGVSLNTANFYDFINWANQYCPIRNVEDVWQEKKSAWELK